MLQWMGGSRRKVTTSRMSTQKRQKQYFEQRKRQQQLEEHSPSVSVPFTRTHETNRSLDVLSMLNLSKNGQDRTSRFPEGRGNSHEEKSTLSYQSPHCPNTIQLKTKNLCPSELAEKRETRIASSPFEERACPQKFSSDFSSRGPPDASRWNNANDPVKMTTDYSELSVIDMLGDDGQTSSSKGNFVRENHVSFSVEGLGKVEMETPAHSPHPTRNMSSGCPALPKNSKRSHTSRNLKFSLEDQFPEMDDVAFGVDVQTDASSLRLPPYLVEPHQNLKQKTMVSEECFLHAAKEFSSNDEYYDRRVEQDRFKWHDMHQSMIHSSNLLFPENSRLLDENFLDDTYDLSRKNWPYDLDSSMVNHMRSRKYDKPEFSFEGLQTQRNRASSKAACSFNMSEFSSPYKHQKEHSYDFMTADMRCYPTTRRNSDFNDMAHSSAWSSFATEDVRDYPSFLSKDACISPAVWCEESKNPPFYSTERQKIRVHEADYRSPVNKFSKKRNSFRMSDFSSAGDDWLYEQCNLENKKSDYASMNASKTRKPIPFSYNHWTEEPLDSDFNPKYSADYKSSDHDAFNDNLFPNKVAFCQQVSPGHSSPIIRNINEECGHHESSNDPLKEEIFSPKIQYQESVSTGTQSATLPSVSSTLDQSNYSSSANNGSPVNVVDSEDNQSRFDESKIKTPEMTPRPHAAPSPLRSEGGSSSVAMPHEPEGDVSKEHSNGTQTSLSSLNKHKEDSGDGKGDLKHEGPHRNVGQSRQVMMLGRFVLQLM